MADNNNYTPTPEDIRLLRELNTLRRELDRPPIEMFDIKSAQALPDLIKQTRKELDQTEGTASNLYDQIRGILTEFKGQKKAINLVRSGLSKTADVSREIRDIELGIADLDLKRIKQLQRQSTVQKSILDFNLPKVLEEVADLELTREAALIASEGRTSNLVDLTRDQKQYLLETLTDFEDFTEEQRAALALFLDQENAITKLGPAIEKVEQRARNFNKATGLTGALLDNLGRIGVRQFGGLGINLGAFQDGLDAAQEEIKSVGKELADDESISIFEKRLITFGKALPGIKDGVKEALSDPLPIAIALIGKLFSGFKEVESAAVDLRRVTGETVTAADGLNTRFATTSQLLEVATSLSDQLGLNIKSSIGTDTLAAAAELQNLLGLSVEQSTKLASITFATGENLDDNTDAIVNSVNEFNQLNKTAIVHGKILKDVAEASDGITASFGGSTEAIAAASAAARRLGLELSDLDSIANSILDFESSIENELQAQLLTGRALNLQRARELALANDLEGVGRELFSNSADLLEFGSMNRIQQEAQAKALGLTRDQLAGIAYQRAIENKLTGEALEKATGMTKQQLEARTASESMNLAIQSMAQALTPVVVQLSRIVQFAAENFKLISLAAVTVGTLYGTYKGILAVEKGLKAIEQIRLGLAVAAEARQNRINKLKAQEVLIEKRGLSTSIAKAAAFAAANPKTAIAGAIAAATIGTLLYKFATKPVEDGVIDPNGGLVVSKPAGSMQYQLDKNDYVLASTNPPMTQREPAQPQVTVNQDMSPVVDSINELISVVKKGGNVSIDGNKLAQAVTLTSYKSN